MKKRTYFTETEIEYLTARARKESAAEIARALGRDPSVIRMKILRLGLDQCAKETHWKPEEIKKLKDLAGRQEVLDIAKALGRTETSVVAKMRRLGLNQRFLKARDFKLSPLFAAYFAGLVDGEGCISVIAGWRKPDRPYLMGLLSVTNTDERLFDRLTPNLPSLKLKQISRRATDRRRTCFKIEVREPWLYQTLLDIRPHLLIKDRQADLLIEFCELRRELGANYLTRRAVEITLELRNLHATNWYNSAHRKKSVDKLKHFLKELDSQPQLPKLQGEEHPEVAQS